MDYTRVKCILEVTKTFPQQNICTICFCLKEETKKSLAEFFGLPENADHNEIGKAIFEYHNQTK